MTRTARTWIVLAALSPTALAATLSGRVVDEAGQPVAEVDLDFTHVATGQDVVASNDRTAADGTYSVTLPNGIYDVFYEPPPGSQLAGHVEPGLNLFTPQSIDVVVRAAVLIEGVIFRDDTAGPAAGIDLDFLDLTTGVKIFTPRDDTGVDGRYAVAVPAGIYDVTYEVPGERAPNEGLLPTSLRELSVLGTTDLTLPTVTLAPGHLVQGEVLDSKGDAVVGVDLDFVPIGSREAVLTTSDNSDTLGTFDPIVPAGSFELRFRPPTGSEQAALTVSPVEIDGDTVLGTFELPDGSAVTGLVTDADGAPLAGVRIEALDSAGDPVDQTEAWSDAAGLYQVTLADGLYDLRLESHRSTLVGPTTLVGVSVSGSTALSTTTLPFRDRDADAIFDVDDLCPEVSDPGQDDSDGDGVGDACDRCPLDFDPDQRDDDRDGIGNACDADLDGDGLLAADDGDDDGDGISDVDDLCPRAHDPSQRDRDSDGLGDACDDDDGVVHRMYALDVDTFVAAPEQGAADYEVRRQTLSYLSTMNFGPCLRDGLPRPLFDDSELPAEGEVFLYQLLPRGADGGGSLGESSAGEPRPDLRPCPGVGL